MNYKLYKDTNPKYSALQQVLYNRGIPIEEQEEWLHASREDIYDYNLIDEDKILQATQLLKGAIDNNEDVVTVVDADCDGYTSSAILMNYLYSRYPKWYSEHMYYIHHAGKEHGYNDVIEQILNIKPLIAFAPDGGSNDVAAHITMFQNEIIPITLDHHDIEDVEAIKDSPAIIINVQLSNYPNKSLTGAGVTFKFCQAYEDYYFDGEDNLDWLMDLCALGNCGDMADLREKEIRAIMNIGLNNIQNEFFKAMTEKNAYSIDKMNGINYYSMAFYVVPFINACVRSGTPKEKDTIFQSMLNSENRKSVPSSKRGAKGTMVPLYQEAVLVADRVKRKQTKLQDEAMSFLEQKIKDENLLDDAMLLLLCNPGEVEKNLAGLVANKLQAKYQRPTAVLTRNKSKDDKEYFYRGSMRNYSLSENTDLKKTLVDTGHIEFCSGHSNAAGLGIAESELSAFIESMNEAYKNINQEPTYYVDYIWTKDTIDSDKIIDIGGFNIYGQNIAESEVCIKDVPLDSSMITLMSREKNPTLKIQVGDVAFIKFKSSEEEFNSFCENGQTLTVIGKCQQNVWNGQVSAQIIVKDYELDEDWIF